MKGKAVERAVCASITAVAADGTSKFRGCMNSDLVLASGVKRELHKSFSMRSSKHLEACHSLSAVGGVLRAEDLMLGSLADVAADDTAVFFDRSVENGNVCPGKHHIVPVMLHRFFCLHCFGKHHQPGGVAVKSVDDENLVERIYFLDIVAKNTVGRFFCSFRIIVDRQ